MIVKDSPLLSDRCIKCQIKITWNLKDENKIDISCLFVGFLPYKLNVILFSRRIGDAMASLESEDLPLSRIESRKLSTHRLIPASLRNVQFLISIYVWPSMTVTLTMHVSFLQLVHLFMLSVCLCIILWK